MIIMVEVVVAAAAVVVKVAVGLILALLANIGIVYCNVWPALGKWENRLVIKANIVSNA